MSGSHHGILTDIRCWFSLLFDWDSRQPKQDWETSPQQSLAETQINKSSLNNVVPATTTATDTFNEQDSELGKGIEVSYVG